MSVVRDANAQKVGDQRYEAFGALRERTGSMPTDRLYTGQTLDGESGLMDG